uniref:Global nitrogen transcriptional regulator n=1 Tax=Dasyclonium flaccidum TaxID=2007274 RepID=A0A1Z1MLA8_9FLOR|nr:global nitrogen transcriptional regulator [Dasyclonium flaccidum]ARW66716.1 global nitrogen transcriptional regulator [Dasyclonium flaccidum]
MKWINFFTDYNIPYYVYKLNKEDAIIINNCRKNKDTSIIILYGSIYITKIFKENTIIPLVILNHNSIFHLKKKNIRTKFYYKITALEQSYIISFRLSHINNRRKINRKITLGIINSYQITLNKYEVMNEIINQKYIKNKVVQLILLLCLDFGIINNTKVHIPFKISQKHLATMIGNNTNNINRVIQYLYQEKFLQYSNKKRICILNIFNNNFKY